MTNIEQIQNRILEQMQEILSNEQLQKLENVMAIEFHGIEVQQECRQQRNPFTGNSNVCRTSKTGYNDDVRNSQ